MARKKPPPRVVVNRSRNNAKRQLSVVMPSQASMQKLCSCIKYGASAKHKYNPTAYGLAPYAGQDVERTYCDEHAKFGKDDIPRIKNLLKRGVMLGLWSEQERDDFPGLLWTIDDSGWVFELRITNSGQAEYHGYPLLQADAFVNNVLARARALAFSDDYLPIEEDQSVRAAISAAENFYR